MSRSQQDQGSQEWKDAYIEAFKTLPVVRIASQTAGVSRETVRRSMNLDPDFAKRVQDAREEGIERLEITAWQFATKKNGERMLQFLLKSLKPDVYGDKQQIGLDHQLSGGKFTIKLDGELDKGETLADDN
tara:strand:+ start:1873 stop:2265 length:393 start_codon:yes stop_codon:yes gene_type:complete